MAFTKILLGNLPELTNEIIQYFRDDFSTLHSCILVNRLWCRLAIPLLWENPFSLKYPKNYHYIEVYLYKLNDGDKMQLNKQINNELLPSNTLFNYSNFIQHLDIHKIIVSIGWWANKYTEDFSFMKFILKSLIKIFDESEAKIHTLYVVHSDSYCEMIVSELVLRSPNFICNIRNLYLKINAYIKTLNIYRYQKLEENLCHIIDSQQNLKKISLFLGFITPLYHSLLLSKNPNCTNTLRTIIFHRIDFKNIAVSNDISEQSNVLESIHILYCYSLDSNFFQQIINLTEPFKLKSLFVENPLTEQLQLLLQKSGNYLENFGLELFNGLLTQEQELLELIIKYCSTNIKFLKFRGFEDQNIYKIFQLIEKVGLSLNYLIIETYDDDLCSLILQNLGQILPPKLEYLGLILIINTSDFEIFLKNLQNSFIKKLSIKNIKGKESVNKNNLSVIKEHIMKKKRVKFLAFQELFIRNNHVDLISLKNEVEEFKLHNIIVLGYRGSIIDTYEFIYKMYSYYNDF